MRFFGNRPTTAANPQPATADLAPGGGPRVVVVIVNYRTAELVIDCLRSLAADPARVPGTRVVVADNASGDDSARRLAAAIAAERWGDWVTLRVLDRNGGFAAGNNAAIGPVLASAQPPQYLWLLNPDTRALPGALRALVEYLDAHPAMGIAGSRTEAPTGKVRQSVFRFPSVLSELDQGVRWGRLTRLLHRWVWTPPLPADAQPVDWVEGASLLVRREVFDTIGLLDEGYFLYFEEVDFCCAARRAGWGCAFVPQSRVVHLGGSSTGLGPGIPRQRRPAYWFDSRRRYLVKNLGPARAAAADGLRLAGFALWRLRRQLQRKADHDPPRFLWDLFRHSVFCRGFRI